MKDFFCQSLLNLFDYWMWIVDFKINPFYVILSNIWGSVCENSWGNDCLGSLKERQRKQDYSGKGTRFKTEIKVRNFSLWLGNEKVLIDDDGGLSMAGLVDRWKWYQFISPKDVAKELGWEDHRV